MKGNYYLLSPILREKGKRWFDPHFGFAYKPIDTNVKIIFVSDIGGTNTQEIVFNQTFNSIDNNWQYFFKNLSEVDFLHDAWSDISQPELLWQIILLFDVSDGGSISVDNIGLFSFQK